MQTKQTCQTALFTVVHFSSFYNTLYQLRAIIPDAFFFIFFFIYLLGTFYVVVISMPLVDGSKLQRAEAPLVQCSKLLKRQDPVNKKKSIDNNNC